MSTVFIRDHDVVDGFLRVLDDMDLIRGNVAYSHADVPIITNRLMTALNQLSYDDQTNAAIFRIVMGTLARAEATYGMAGSCLKFISGVARIVASTITAGENKIVTSDRLKSCQKRMLDAISMNSRSVSIDDIKRILDASYDETIAGMIMAALDLSGITGRISLEKGVGTQHRIEMTSGYVFDLVPTTTLNVSIPWARQNVRCVIIDGIVETVAEIHHLFQTCHERNEPLLLVCRGLGDDVASTIVTNRLRKTLDVSAHVARFDVGGANILNDIATVCGCDVVSSLKGDLISSIRYDDVAVVDCVSAIASSVTITNASTRYNVAEHMKYLETQRDKNPHLAEIYDARIGSLSSNRVMISVGGSPGQSQSTFENVDAALRNVRALMGSGAIRVSDLSVLNDPIDACLQAALSSDDHVPAAAAGTIVKHGMQCIRTVLLSAGMVLQQEDARVTHV